MSLYNYNNKHTGSLRYETLITNGRLGKKKKIVILSFGVKIYILIKLNYNV